MVRRGILGRSCGDVKEEGSKRLEEAGEDGSRMRVKRKKEEKEENVKRKAKFKYTMFPRNQVLIIYSVHVGPLSFDFFVPRISYLFQLGGEDALLHVQMCKIW